MLRTFMRVFVAAIALVLLTRLALAQESTPTPLPPVDLRGVTGLPQSSSPQGYPQLGQPDAPVQIIAYCSFDAPACGSFFSEAFPAVLTDVAQGDANYTFVPLYGLGEIANGRAGARAALCAQEQGAFWRAAEMFYGWQIEFGKTALDGSRVIGGVESLGINRASWDACMSSDHPDTLLDSARADASAQIGFDGQTVPFVLVNGVPSLPDAASIDSAINLLLGRLAATETPEATAEGTADATPDNLVVTVEPLLGQKIDPPLDITLPTGWRYGSDTLILHDVDVEMRTIPLAVYTGPVTGGTGTIVLLWGFPSLVAGNPFTGGAQPDLWTDGLRLLRLAVIEEGCNIGTDLRTQYSIGGLSAVGTQFSAVDCPQLPNTRGWFSGVRISGINFVFYVFTDPIDAMNTAQKELQGILDTVVFNVPEPTAEPRP